MSLASKSSNIYAITSLSFVGVRGLTSQMKRIPHFCIMLQSNPLIMREPMHDSV
jgi:hypothetical protein